MRAIFVDTNYLVALFQESDQWHERAKTAENLVEGLSYVTTDAVLCELLNHFSKFGAQTRRGIAAAVHEVLTDPDFIVLEQTRAAFLSGLELYESRLDKGYSLTDCISMNTCRELAIKEILTHDRHFEQEGFKILL